MEEVGACGSERRIRSRMTRRRRMKANEGDVVYSQCHSLTTEDLKKVREGDVDDQRRLCV